MRNQTAKQLRTKATQIIGNAPFKIASQGAHTDKQVIRNEYKKLKAGYKELNHKERGVFNSLQA